jgi:hypothetical protein
MLIQNEKVARSTLFKGKVVLVYMINAAPEFSGGIAICDPVLEDSNGRTFIVGTVPGMFDDWTSGQTVGVALDQVAHYLEFPSEQEFIEKSSFWNQGNAAN